MIAAALSRLLHQTVHSRDAVDDGFPSSPQGILQIFYAGFVHAVSTGAAGIPEAWKRS